MKSKVLRAREQIFKEKKRQKLEENNINEEILLLENQYTSQDCSLLLRFLYDEFFFLGMR
jgi:hypothetical protein